MEDCTCVVRDLSYVVRIAQEADAKELSQVRLQIDGETEYLDREQGEDFLSETDFKELINEDRTEANRLFLVAESQGSIIGFSRCAGSDLKRLSHQVEFGVGVLKDYWGYRVGKELLQQSIRWAENNQIMKITLRVLETNEKAIEMYKRSGFKVEGVLKKDKRLSDKNYYSTILMARFT
ncbi:GNAT family N-acetyltransferase [Halobacillus sp. Nhm2S1]|uniref:GNAT family N-acetyltransferase n=1 Tax=Halobacillus sp. Nhm2S1 TaxID=2866716 RepID=UPI001C72FF03|nr:GNAT family N-acetyltransferase [Halobacillus sp. Nhm2S1]MBX0356781.1 GNAT family N-acetyltransferase [Halobacillus sp. Nhm2S1]